MKNAQKKIPASSETHVYVRKGVNSSDLSKCCIWVERKNFYGGAPELLSKKDKNGKKSKGSKKPKSDPNEPFLIIGFDTEFKTPDRAMERSEIYEGKGKYKVLSYQVACKVIDPVNGNSNQWEAICYPEDGEVENRLKLSDVITFAISEGINTGVVKSVPIKIYLVGHFTRADIPAFGDFADLKKFMSSVRNTFLSIDNYLPIEFSFPEKNSSADNAEGSSSVTLKVLIRDTMLLTPAASKGLRALGEIVGVEKVVIDPNPKQEKFYKRNMDKLLKQKPELFEKYAIADAVICLKYAEQLINQTQFLLGTSKIPATLTSIGVDLLWKSWETRNLDPHYLTGKENVTERIYNKRLNRTERKTFTVNLERVDWHLRIATESYHGGRNEQFWFGPGFESDWTDYDLTSAYPSAMSVIGMPDWKNIKVSTDIDEFTPTSLGACQVEFEFPPETRFPTLPVRTDNGLVFPLKGKSYCCSPELNLARQLGAKLKIHHGILVPTKSDDWVFRDFIKDCLKQRSNYKKKSLQNLFWKELSNSTYGKTAQGLHKKRVFDMKDGETKDLPPSRITNPYYAGFITSFVRAVLGEIMNALPKNVCIFSCTTDGFLTTANEQQMHAVSSGTFVSLYRQSRQALTGDPNHLEPKHYIRKPLGWRTRGQATLIPGKHKDLSLNVLLAKGGIYLDEDLEDTESQNEYICNLFLQRRPSDKIEMKIKAGIRDIVQLDNDLVEKQFQKRLNMEFDWKRKPFAMRFVDNLQHIAFETVPWSTVEEFEKMRKHWEKMWTTVETAYCIKTLEDFNQFAKSVFTKSSLGEENSKYLNSKTPDITKLRRTLGSAWKHSRAGLVYQLNNMSNSQFAAMLSSCGIPCKRSDVENDAKKKFIPNNCPGTPDVMRALDQLKIKLPKLQIDDLLIETEAAIDLFNLDKVSSVHLDLATNSRSQG